MKKLLPLLLALCLTLSACAAPAAVPLPGDSVTAVTVTYAGKTVTCTDPAQVRAMTDAARSLEFVPTDASVTTPGAMSMELTFTDSSGSDPKAPSAPSSCEPDHNPCMGSRPPYECPAKRHSKNFIEKR